MNDQPTIQCDEETEPHPESEWMVIEIMGHRKRGGLVTEVQKYGATMLRIDRYGPGDTDPFGTEYYGGAAIFAAHPATEETAREVEKWQRPRADRQLQLDHVQTHQLDEDGHEIDDEDWP